MISRTLFMSAAALMAIMTAPVAMGTKLDETSFDELGLAEVLDPTDLSYRLAEVHSAAGQGNSGGKSGNGPKAPGGSGGSG